MTAMQRVEAQCLMAYDRRTFTPPASIEVDPDLWQQFRAEYLVWKCKEDEAFANLNADRFEEIQRLDYVPCGDTKVYPRGMPQSMIE